MSLAEKKSYASSSLPAENKTRRERTCQLAIMKFLVYNFISDDGVG